MNGFNLTRRLFAEWLGTAFLLAIVVARELWESAYQAGTTR